MDDPVSTWFDTVLLALHEVLLEAHPRLARRELWQALNEEVRPQLEKQRTYIFFTLGSSPEKLDPGRVAKAIFLEALKREKRGREPTEVLPLNEPEERELPYLNDATLIEDIIMLTEKDVEFTE